MKYCNEKFVSSFFLKLNRSNINYILLRNLNNELPDKLPFNKDIDLIINEFDELKFDTFLQNDGWKKKKHPLGHFPYLYGLKPFKFYFKNGVKLDVCYQLACRSLNKGEWFPLDMEIQTDLWNDKIIIKNKPWRFTLSKNDELVHLTTRCIFDKKKFSDDYINRIEELLPEIDSEKVFNKFNLIFFKYSKILLQKLTNKEYDNIIINYLQFKNY